MYVGYCFRMPRKKPKYVPKNKRCQWMEEDMEKAIRAVRENKIGTLKASKHFNVPRGTLGDVSKKVDVSPSKLVSAKLGRKPILGHELEKELVTNCTWSQCFMVLPLVTYDEWHFNLQLKMVLTTLSNMEKRPVLGLIYFYNAIKMSFPCVNHVARLFLVP